jgi:transposase
VLFVGDDWAEDHHDVEIVNAAGRRLARRRLPEGLGGMSRLHALIAAVMPADWAQLEPWEAASRVKIGIETERGPWVAALLAAGYEVFAINPMSTARYRERHSTSGAKSDAGDAHLLAEIVRLDRDHHRAVAADSAAGEAMKLVARSHQTLIWERTRHVLRLRSALREYFPAALSAYGELDEPDTLELLAAAPDPDRAARLSKSKITADLNRANRRDVDRRAAEIQAALRASALRQPPAVQSAFAAIAAGEVRLISVLNREVEALGEVVGEHFGRHPDAEIYASQPGLGIILGARPKHRPPSRASPTPQPPRRYPPRLPQGPCPLRRIHRLGPPQHSCRLTYQNLGCLPLSGHGRVARHRRSPMKTSGAEWPVSRGGRPFLKPDLMLLGVPELGNRWRDKLHRAGLKWITPACRWIPVAVVEAYRIAVMIDDDEVLAVDDRIADTAMGVQVERKRGCGCTGRRRRTHPRGLVSNARAARQGRHRHSAYQGDRSQSQPRHEYLPRMTFRHIDNVRPAAQRCPHSPPDVLQVRGDMPLRGACVGR